MIPQVITSIYKLKIKSEPSYRHRLDLTLRKEHLSNGKWVTFPTNGQRRFSQAALLFYQKHLPPLRTSHTGHHKTRCHTWEKIQLMIFIFKSMKLPMKEPQLEQLSKVNWEITFKIKLLMSGTSDISQTNGLKPSFQAQLLSSPKHLHQLKMFLTGPLRTRCHTRERTLLMISIFKPVMMKWLLVKLDYKLLRCKLKWTQLLVRLMPKELNNKLNLKQTSKMMILKPNSKDSWTPNKVFIDFLQTSVPNPIWKKWLLWHKSSESQWLLNWCNSVTMKLSQTLS